MGEGLKKVKTNHRNIGGGSLQEEEDCKCKGPEAGMCIVYAKNKEANVAAARCGRGGGGVDRAITKGCGFPQIDRGADGQNDLL